MNVPLSRTTGFSSQTRNVGALTNKGIEIEMDFSVVDSRDFKFNLGGNLSTNENEVTQLAVDGEGEEITITSSVQRTETGHPVYAYYMPTWAGVNPDTGKNEFFVNGVDGEKTSVFNEAKQVFQGGAAIPTLNWGLNLNLEFKDFFLTSSGYFAGGHKVYEGWHLYLNEPNVYPILYYNGYNTLMNRWQKPGDVTNVAKLSAGGQPWQRQSRFLHDGDYFRLRDVTFGYNVPSAFLANSGVKSARLFVRGSNLYTWVKDPDNLYDPEQGISGVSNQISTPATKSILLGANIKF